VREFSLPALAQIPATANLANVVFRRATEQPQAVVLRRPAGSSGWADVTASQLRAALGGRVQYAISGGAALSERLCHFFRGIDVTVLEGYGLTER
jgi:long-subunit acyl-CoA synthetase (AMP-forming)